MQYVISLLLASLCYFLITLLMFYNILFMFVFCFVFFTSILRILCFCIVLYCFVYYFSFCAVSFLFLYESIDHCQRVETQLQLRNIMS